MATGGSKPNLPGEGDFLVGIRAGDGTGCNGIVTVTKDTDAPDQDAVLVEWHATRETGEGGVGNNPPQARGHRRIGRDGRKWLLAEAVNVRPGVMRIIDPDEGAIDPVREAGGEIRLDDEPGGPAGEGVLVAVEETSHPGPADDLTNFGTGRDGSGGGVPDGEHIALAIDDRNQAVR
jgi:hypothetical protein